MNKRVSYLVDGFNLYHSIDDALRAQSIQKGKWLDIRNLCQSTLSMFSPSQLQSIHYFSALATFRPDKVVRHQQLIKAMEADGVTVTLGKFKKKTINCKLCHQPFTSHEEKETDVNIAMKLLELLHNDECDVAVIVSGDTDLATALRTAKRLFPAKMFGVVVPHKRHNAKLNGLAHKSTVLKPHHYERFQYPNSLTTANGDVIQKPLSW